MIGLENGKYVSPAPLEENLKLSSLVEQCVLDGRNLRNTYLIVHPSIGALRKALGDINTLTCALTDSDFRGYLKDTIRLERFRNTRRKS